MPLGLIFMKWNDLTGNEILAKIPEDLDINDRILMQIFEIHDRGGEKGIISLRVGSINSISYYSGLETNYCVALFLNLDDDPDDYESGVLDISLTILQNLDDKAYLKMFPSLFRQLLVYPTLNYEQRLAMIYQNNIKRQIINLLRGEGVISQSELITWFKDNFSYGFTDIEPILSEFIQNGIINVLSVKGERSLLIFFMKDLVTFRVPPFKLLINPFDCGIPKELVAVYQTECNKFFQDYQRSEEDNIKVIRLLCNPQVYETLKLFRERAINRKDLEMFKEKGVDDINFAIKLLTDAQMIGSFQDSKQTEFYILLTDFFIEFFTPEYILSTIKTHHEQKIKSDQVLIKYLDLLKEANSS
ncbi:MAG: hypothetical protein ACFFAN_17245 [Promethearchaeota archaeon]